MRMRNRSIYAAGAAATLLAACSAEPAQPPAEPEPQDAFWAALSEHCGEAYRGMLVSEDAADADFRAAEMVMHVRECSDERIAIPFHIRAPGEEWDRSRTWLVTRTPDGLRLKHDHRHEDGEADAVTMYGGDTAEAGSATGQDFPVDAESIALFEREGLAASVTNTWRVEVDGERFAYQLTRPPADGAAQGRLFRAEFDLTQPVEAPPAPWGHE